MTIIDQIEQSFRTATSVQFHPTDNYEKEPPVVALVFDRQHDGATGYNLLLDNYQNKDTTLVINKRDKKYLDISLVNKLTADAINVNNLTYDNTQLTDFFNKEPKDRKFVFVIAFIDEGRLTFTATREPYLPFWVDKYHTL